MSLCSKIWLVSFRRALMTWSLNLYFREYTSGILRKNFSQGYCVPTVFLFFCSLKIGVNFSFVLTLKSAVKSSRRTRCTYICILSTITISLVITVSLCCIIIYKFSS